MPVKQYTGVNRSAIIVGLASVLGLVAMIFLGSRILSLASDGDLQVASDTQVFQAGEAEERAADIAERGPVYFPDLVGRDRDIYLQHLGDDPETGWLSFGIRATGAAPDCFVEWDADRRVFIDKCDATEYPEDGTGLPSYPVTLHDDGTLSIDLNAADRAAEAVTSTSESE